MRTSVARGALLGVLGQVWQLAAAFLLYSFLARQLGPELFGQWRVVLSVLGWFAIVLQSGVADMAIKTLAGSPPESRTWSRAAYVAQTLSILVVFGLLMVLADVIADLLGDPALGTLIRISALDVPTFGLFMIANAVALGHHRFGRQVAALAAFSTAKLAAIVVLVTLGFGVPGALIGSVAASATGFLVAFRLSDARATGDAVMPYVRRLWIGAPAFVALNLVEGLGQSVDLWLVSAVIANATAVGWYASAMVLADIPMFLFGGLTRITFPSVARALADNDLALASRYTMQTVRIGIIVTVLGVGLIAANGRLVLELLYSSAYVGAFIPLVILMTAAMGRVVREACTDVLMIRDERGRAITILVATVAVEIALIAVLGPRYGIAGAAAAASTAALLGGVWAAYSVRDLLGPRPLATLARSAVASGVVAAVLSLGSLPPVSVLVTFPLGGVAYLAILWLLREFDANDIASVREAIGR